MLNVRLPTSNLHKPYWQNRPNHTLDVCQIILIGGFNKSFYAWIFKIPDKYQFTEQIPRIFSTYLYYSNVIRFVCYSNNNFLRLFFFVPVSRSFIWIRIEWESVEKSGRLLCYNRRENIDIFFMKIWEKKISLD